MGEKKWCVLVRRNGKTYLKDRFATEDEAIRDCEQWGWRYDNGNTSYTMLIEYDSPITERR
jgi:hypothetical protein